MLAVVIVLAVVAAGAVWLLIVNDRELRYYAATEPEGPAAMAQDSLVFIPGEDFDPYDPDDVEAVGLAMERERADTVDALRAENARLRDRIAELDPPF